MAQQIVAPPSPGRAARARAEALTKKPNRTPAETNELLTLVLARLDALEGKD